MCHDNVRLETQDIFAMFAQSWQQIDRSGWTPIPEPLENLAAL